MRRDSRYELLDQACGPLEKLSELGVGALFWGERVEPAKAAAHLSHVRERVTAFQAPSTFNRWRPEAARTQSRTKDHRQHRNVPNTK